MQASHADEGQRFFAPDGIEIVPFDLPGLALLSFVEGRIPPRAESYPVHMHGALEQITYVLQGYVEIETWDGVHERLARFTAGPGDAFLTPPLRTLSFANRGPEVARVLFICAPTYPPDDADTRLTGDHHAPTADERAWSVTRHEAALAAFTRLLGPRMKRLRIEAAE